MNGDPGQKFMVEQTLASIFKSSAKLTDSNEVCGCGRAWMLYQEPFLITQKLVYDIEDDCMRDLFSISCPNCSKTYEFESDPLLHLQSMAEETKKLFIGQPLDGRYFVRAIGKFGPKDEQEEEQGNTRREVH